MGDISYTYSLHGWGYTRQFVVAAGNPVQSMADQSDSCSSCKVTPLVERPEAAALVVELPLGIIQ